MAGLPKPAQLRYYLMPDYRQQKVDYFRRDPNGVWQSGVLCDEETLEIVCSDYRAELRVAGYLLRMLPSNEPLRSASI